MKKPLKLSPLLAIASGLILLTTLTSLNAQTVVNVQFVGDSYTAQTGTAGTGVSSSDYWNPVQGALRGGDDSGSPQDVFITASSLLDNNSATTGVNLSILYSDTVGEEPLSQYYGSDANPVLNSILSTPSGDSFTLTLDLPEGDTYDIYLYASHPSTGGHAASTFTLDGTASHSTSTSAYASGFSEGNQYIVFSGLSGGTHSIGISSSVQPFINGMQIVIHHALVNVQFFGRTYTAMTGLAATGVSSADYWNAVQGGDGGEDQAGPGDFFSQATSLLDNRGVPAGVNLSIFDGNLYGDVPAGLYDATTTIPLLNSHLETPTSDSFNLELDLPVGNTYDLYMYSAYPDADQGYAGTFTLDDGTPEPTSTGSYPIQPYVEGDQYIVFRGVAAGSHIITVSSSGLSPAMNGIQIVFH